MHLVINLVKLTYESYLLYIDVLQKAGLKQRVESVLTMAAMLNTFTIIEPQIRNRYFCISTSILYFHFRYFRIEKNQPG